jgi:hypothetical protein
MEKTCQPVFLLFSGTNSFVVAVQFGKAFTELPLSVNARLVSVLSIEEYVV